MSTILPSDASGGTLQRTAAEAAPARPDFQFWHEVFDQARGAASQGGPGGDSESRQDPRLAPDQGRSQQGKPSSQTGTVHTATHDHGMVTASSVAQAMAQPLGGRAALLSGGLPYAPMPAMPLSAGALHELSHADIADKNAANPGTHHALADDAQAQAALQAHVMLTETGDYKVALRASRHVSAAQALSAVAQALAQQEPGSTDAQVEQVVLNGKAVYQRGAGRDVGLPASSTFELKC